MADNVEPILKKFTNAVERGGRSIQVRPDALHIIATDAERALIASGAPLFVRGGIVKPVLDEMPAAHGRKTKVARLCEVDADCLTDHMSRAASWMKFNARKNDWVPTDPPRNVAQTVLSRDGEWEFQRLAGVITTPTLRPDGTILSEAGYDEATQLLLLEPPSLPPIPDKPTRDDGLRAIETLGMLLEGFPFANEASRSAAFSALITTVVRGALSAVPMHATTAPVAGSGKSYIIDVSAGLGLGDYAPVITAGRTEEETEKRLVSALLNGQAVISIDNVNGELGGDLLCQMIERPIVSVRPLGSSKLVKVENRACVFATGNNIRLVGDMTRRVILCTLDPKTERPELRQFKSDPFALVMANRGKFIAAALTVCRSYAVAGYPNQCRPLASFEDWSKVVRSALVWLGLVDPAETMEQARADDPETASLRSLLRAWRNEFIGEYVTTGRAIERSKDNYNGQYTAPDLHHAMQGVAETKGVLSAIRLGKFLASKKGRIIDGLRFVDSEDSHSKQKVWSVEEV
ncbi:hypothetical protein [Sphingopyxis terrae]|uniref:hypothetical protein n=1 Tax=Sphingopyxis terrae TaxID=33052 RepID=UPI0007892F02|nr:hypothetical protein [Sphingopyxis terrae]